MLAFILFLIIVWIVLFPWVLVTAVWTTNWSEGLRLSRPGHGSGQGWACASREVRCRCRR